MIIPSCWVLFLTCIANLTFDMGGGSFNYTITNYNYINNSLRNDEKKINYLSSEVLKSNDSALRNLT